jgi:nucleotide-binding universal stress UspA family protein
MTQPELTRILVGVDLDDSSAAALAAAAALGRTFNASVTVVHAHNFDQPAYFTAAQMDALHSEREAARARCAADVNAFASSHLRMPFTSLVEEGAPADVIRRLARNYDLIVVGTRRRHGPRRWWLGSVAESVLREAPVPVLVVPSEPPAATTGHAAVPESSERRPS